MMNEPQPLADAYMTGKRDFLAGKSESSPYTDESLAHQYRRGYRNTRKHARFDATIAARKQKGA